MSKRLWLDARQDTMSMGARGRGARPHATKWARTTDKIPCQVVLGCRPRVPGGTVSLGSPCVSGHQLPALAGPLLGTRCGIEQPQRGGDTNRPGWHAGSLRKHKLRRRRASHKDGVGEGGQKAKLREPQKMATDKPKLATWGVPATRTFRPKEQKGREKENRAPNKLQMTEPQPICDWQTDPDGHRSKRVKSGREGKFCAHAWCL